MKGPRLVFSLKGKELCSISFDGYFPGEIKETRGLLAYEHKVDSKDIQIEVIK